MKHLKVLATALTLCTVSALSPARSEAAISIVFFPVSALIATAVFTGVALPISATCSGVRSCRGVAYFGWPLTLAGLVMLDDSSKGQMVAFSALEPSEAQFGTPAQIEAYNHALPYINAVRETIQGDVIEQLDRGVDATGPRVHAMWEGYRSMLSPDAYSVLEKVSAQLSKK